MSISEVSANKIYYLFPELPYGILLCTDIDVSMWFTTCLLVLASLYD